jgi:alkylation response protein AidB-like acyl-CoA dehydrogenase
MPNISKPSTKADRSFLFTADQLNWLSKAEKFADSIPLADILKSDRENEFRRDLFEAACQEGFGALPFAKTYGGFGGDYASFCLVNEEFARRCLPVMSSIGVHVLCQEPIYRYGSEEQKNRYLPKAANGEYLAAFALTEAGAGSDTKALATTARLVGNDYILNGSKVFITSGGAADFYIVMAKLIDDQEFKNVDGKDSITAFIVERNFLGFSLGQKFDMLGMRGYATCEIVFNDCYVPKENLLGIHGQGRKVALSSLAKGRVTIAAQATGWAQGALEALIGCLNGKNFSVLDFQNSVVSSSSAVEQEHFQFEATSTEYILGEMVVNIESARALTYQAASSIDRGDNDVTLASMAKVQATDVAMNVSTKALAMAGFAGLQPELLLERYFRDSKAGQIYEGTNQIQRLLIARNLLR